MAPPFTGIAVKITFVPEHIVDPVFVVILTPGVTVGLTVTLVGIDVAEHPFAFVIVTE